MACRSRSARRRGFERMRQIRRIGDNDRPTRVDSEHDGPIHLDRRIPYCGYGINLVTFEKCHRPGDGCVDRVLQP
jgi:hypothetical protein